jgi:hypothetical protein
MTEEQNPQKPKAGIFLFLGKRKQQRRAFHIPTAPATAARLVQNLNLKGASSTTRSSSSPGSFFEWKRLGRLEGFRPVFRFRLA